MIYLQEGNEEDKEEPSQLGDNVLIIPFVKSPLSVNPAMSSLDKLYLQGQADLFDYYLKKRKTFI